MKTKFLLLAPVAAIALSACSLNGKVYQPSDYIKNLSVALNNGEFRILQLTDTHIGDKDDFKLHSKFMDLTINDAKPDMIIVTGDLFTFASKSTALEFFNWLDGHNVPWTVTFGNHDEQCYFSVDWMTSTLNDFGSNCIFLDLQDDKVQGNANFAINLINKANGKVFEQLIIMDSNRYYYGDYFGYDCFKQNQIDWYKDLVKYTAKEVNGNEDTPVQSLMFYHIPLPEINDAYAYGKEKGILTGVKNEDTCPPDHDFHFFETIKGLGSTKGMFFGHDHINDFRVVYEGVEFVYGLKSTDRIYYDDGMLGGQVISLKENGSYDITQFHHAYKEVK